MNKKVEKFLDFNGKKIFFLGKDGVYWIAIRPICEALNTQYERQYKNLKDDAILGQPLSVQTMVAADGKLRKMVCLPEFYVYGWLMGIQSDAPGLAEFKWECYRVLFEHFHGTITGRKELNKQKAEQLVKREKLLFEKLGTEGYLELTEINGTLNRLQYLLRQNDIDQVEEEKTLFDQ